MTFSHKSTLPSIIPVKVDAIDPSGTKDIDRLISESGIGDRSKAQDNQEAKDDRRTRRGNREASRDNKGALQQNQPSLKRGALLNATSFDWQVLTAMHALFDGFLATYALKL